MVISLLLHSQNLTQEVNSLDILSNKIEDAISAVLPYEQNSVLGLNSTRRIVLCLKRSIMDNVLSVEPGLQIGKNQM